MKRNLTKALLLGGLLAAGCSLALAEHDDDEHQRSAGRVISLDVAPVNNEQYQSECGACHMAYQPGLLPARSWVRLMAALSDHFGEDVELAPPVRKTLTKYLVQFAADGAPYRRSERIMQSLSEANDAPLRITETRYIAREHREIPARLVTANAEVKSLSNCPACHLRAEQGSYREREIRIPGAGRWED